MLSLGATAPFNSLTRGGLHAPHNSITPVTYFNAVPPNNTPCYSHHYTRHAILTYEVAPPRCSLHARCSPVLARLLRPQRTTPLIYTRRHPLHAPHYTAVHSTRYVLPHLRTTSPIYTPQYPCTAQQNVRTYHFISKRTYYAMSHCHSL